VTKPSALDGVTVRRSIFFSLAIAFAYPVRVRVRIRVKDILL
jgi:hypothetical protein